MEPPGKTQRQIIEALKAIAADRSFQLPAIPVKRKIARIDKRVYPLYTGTYSLDSNTVLTITVDGEKLMAQRPGDSPTELLPQDKRRFFVPGSETEFEFLRDDSGQISSMAIYQVGTIILMKQKE